VPVTINATRILPKPATGQPGPAYARGPAAPRGQGPEGPGGRADCYFSLLDPDGEPAAALEGLERATGFLRGRLGKALKVRHVPELRFTHDDSAEEGVRLSALIERTVPAEDQG
jgi:hypothetical protein